MKSGTARYGKEFPKDKITHSKFKTIRELESELQSANTLLAEYELKIRKRTGFRPESIEKMYMALKAEQDLHEHGWFRFKNNGETYYDNSEGWTAIEELKKEALTAIKL